MLNKTDFNDKLNRMATKEHHLYKLVSKEEAEAFAWSFEGPNQEAVLYPLKFPPIQPNEIRIQQTYFGLCFTDCKNVIHFRSSCQLGLVSHQLPKCAWT